MQQTTEETRNNNIETDKLLINSLLQSAMSNRPKISLEVMLNFVKISRRLNS